MTDEEIGRRIIGIINNSPHFGSDEWAKHLGATVRDLLAERPAVTREAVDDFAKRQVRPFGDVDANRKAASEIAHRALTHFAPALATQPDRDAQNDRLTAENARLREALKGLLDEVQQKRKLFNMGPMSSAIAARAAAVEKETQP